MLYVEDEPRAPWPTHKAKPLPPPVHGCAERDWIFSQSIYDVEAKRLQRGRDAFLWLLHNDGMTWAKIGRLFEVTGQRAKQIAMKAEWRILAAIGAEEMPLLPPDDFYR